MHLKPAYFKFVEANAFTRNGLTKIACLFRSDGFSMKKCVFPPGQVFYKPLYVVSKLYSALPQETAPLCETEVKYEPFSSKDLFDEQNKMLVLRYEREIESLCLTQTYNTRISNFYENRYRAHEFKQHLVQLQPFLCDSPLSYRGTGTLSLANNTIAINDYMPLCFHYATHLESLLPFSGSTILLSEDKSTETSAKDMETCEKASEKELLKVKEHLCNSILNFFSKTHDFSLYREDIEFVNHIGQIKTAGLKVYVLQMYVLRYYGSVHYVRVKSEILKVTHHVEDSTVRVRWRIKGVSRTKLLLMSWQLRHKTWKEYYKEHAEWLDGFSVFSIDKNGLIYRHVCDKMMPDEEIAGKQISVRTRLLGLLGLVRRPTAIGGVHSMLLCLPSLDSDSCNICKKLK